MGRIAVRTVLVIVLVGFGWVVGPFVNSIPRESLAFTMERTRDALRGQ